MQDCRRSWWILKAENREPFDENRRQWRGKFKQWIDLTTHNREWKIGEGLRGGVVVSTVASQQPIQVWFPACGLSVWSLHVLPVYEWILSRYSGFLPPTKILGQLVSLKLSLRVTMSMCVVVCGPGITAGIGSSPDQWIKRVQKMDGWMP